MTQPIKLYVTMIQNEIYNYIFSKFQNETAIDGIA